MANKQGKFSLGISIRVDTKKAEQEILREAVKQINRNIEAKIKNIEKRIGDGFVERLKETPTYDSLVSDRGDLRVHFGLANPKSTMNNILAKLRLCFTSEYTRAKVTGGKIQGSFSVKFNKQDFSFLYEEASFRSFFLGIFKRRPQSSYKSKGGKVDWLRWLLESGTGNILTDVRIKIKEFDSPYPSRTGGAIMVPGQGWGVPQRFAGTTNDNWLTRTLSEYQKDVEQVVNEIITDGLRNVSN